MKIIDDRPEIQSSGNMQEQSFSIKDQGMIFDILRNKMYSNPIQAICREISCNARDAHREVGKESSPIHIQLPNYLEPIFKIRDFGPGISPDRMSNIFIQYTASTKRSDNKQTGGFGLGAKTPFSYSDTFNIVTIHDKVKYNYAAYIDESKVGKMVLMSSSQTDEENGTEIIIPVKSQDFGTFAKWAEFCTRYFEVKPKFTGASIPNRQNKIIFSNDKCFVYQPEYNNSPSKHPPILIIDGVEYPLDANALASYTDLSTVDYMKASIAIKFGVGELSLSANRESVYLDDKTKKEISNRIQECVEEFKKSCIKDLASKKTYIEAQKYINDIASKNFSCYQKFNWNNIPISSGVTYFDIRYNSGVIKGVNFYKNTGYKKESWKMHATDRIDFYRPTTKIIYNDVEIVDFSPSFGKVIAESHPGFDEYVILSVPKEREADANKLFHLDKCDFTKLSTITTSLTKKKDIKSKTIVFKWNGSDFGHIAIQSMKDNTDKKAICVIEKKEYEHYYKVNLDNTIKNSSVIGSKYISWFLSNNKNYSFYGVKDEKTRAALIADYPDLKIQKIEDVMSANMVDISKFDAAKYSALKGFISNTYKITSNFKRISIQDFMQKIKNKNTVFYKNLLLIEEAYKFTDENSDKYYLYESLIGIPRNTEIDKFHAQNPQFDAALATQSFYDRYPLVRTTCYSVTADNIIDYINFVDGK